MDEKTWHIYQNKKQEGPFSAKEIKELILNNMIAQNAFFFKLGWKEWRPHKDCLQELEVTTDRRRNAPRSNIEGQIIIHNNNELIKGKGANISSTGIFIETNESLFKIGEKIKLTCKVKGLSKAFHVQATVVRYAQLAPKGYGLQFDDLDTGIKQDIEKLTKDLNQK
jgi:Tfp pilus assembly protein PilZ